MILQTFSVKFCKLHKNICYMFEIVVNDNLGIKNLLTITGGVNYSIIYNDVEFANGTLPAAIQMPQDVNGAIKKGIYTVTIDGAKHVFDYQYTPISLSVDVLVNGFESSIRFDDTSVYGGSIIISRVLTIVNPLNVSEDTSGNKSYTNIYSGNWVYDLKVNYEINFPSNLKVKDYVTLHGERFVYNITQNNVFDAANNLKDDYIKNNRINITLAEKRENDVLSVQAELNSYYRYIISNDALSAYKCLESVASIVNLSKEIKLIIPFTVTIGSSVDTYLSKLNAQDNPRYIQEMLGSTLRIVGGKIESTLINPIVTPGDYNNVTVNGFGFVTGGSKVDYQPLSDVLSGLDKVTTTGIGIKNGNSFITRNIEGNGKILVENGDGIGGNIKVTHFKPQVKLADISNKLINSISFDDYGHVIGASSGTINDILGYTPENSLFKGQPNGYVPLDENGKVSNRYIQLSGMSFKETWNASTNTPALSNGVGTNGDWYSVVTGGTALGITWLAGDRAIYDGSKWAREPNVATVSSVFGRVGDVTATGNDFTSYYLRYDAGQTLTQAQKNQAAANLGAKLFTYDAATDTWIFDGKARFTGNLASSGNVVAYQGGGVIPDDIMNRITIATPTIYGIVKYDNLTIGLNSSGQLAVLGGFLPNQTGQKDKYLRTNGSSPYWDNLPSDIATQTWVTQNVIGAAPENLNALNELATALGNDPNFATTITNLIGTKSPINNPVFTGTPKVGLNNIWHAGNAPSIFYEKGDLVSNIAFDAIYGNGSYFNAVGNGTGNTNVPDTYGTLVSFGSDYFGGKLHFPPDTGSSAGLKWMPKFQNNPASWHTLYDTHNANLPGVDWLANNLKSRTVKIADANGVTQWTAQLGINNSLEFYNTSNILEFRLSQSGKMEVRDNIVAYSPLN